MSINFAYSSWHGSQNMDSDEKKENKEVDVGEKRTKKEDEEDGRGSGEEKEEGESDEAEGHFKESMLTRGRG